MNKLGLRTQVLVIEGREHSSYHQRLEAILPEHNDFRQRVPETQVWQLVTGIKH